MAERAPDPTTVRREIITAQCRLWGGFCCFPISGKCHSCGYDIAAYTPVSKMKSQPITGCPKCNRSFVE